MKSRRLLALAMILGMTAQAGCAAGFVDPQVDRTQTQIGNWKFIASNSLTGAEAITFNDASWSSVTVPHTWDTVDASSNSIADYSNSWYRTHLTLPAGDAGKQVYLKFEGAFQIADVYVNGIHLGQHRGGYTAFTFDATSSVRFGADNVVAVKVSNKNCPDCLPDGNARLFKGYGGIYRKAWLVETNKYQVSNTDYSSSGVYVTQTNVRAQQAAVSIRTVVRNADSVTKTFTVKNFVVDAYRNVVLSLKQDVVVAAKSSANVVQSGVVINPKLWSNAKPYLYSVYADVWVDGTITDFVRETTGFRYYQLTTSAFTLNGESALLRGVSKHQESETSASAVSDAELVTDWGNLSDLGVYFVRLPHYPHAKLEYDLADERGIMVWAENGHTNGADPSTNSDTLTREMVYQNFNHPSIVFWSAGNESSNTGAASHYGQVIKEADPTRPTVYANLAGGSRTLANIDFTFFNQYPGWYSGTMYDFASEASSSHYISESGAGAVMATHTADYFAMKHTADSFEPEEYGQLVNEVKFQTLFVTAPSSIPAFADWAFRDFADAKYKNHVNTKGLVTMSNYRKDIYYHLKSFLTAVPVVHVVGDDYFVRGANPAGHGDVKVYSNTRVVNLTINGVAVGAVANGTYKHPNGTVIDNVFLWSNALKLGKNVIIADDRAGHSDTITVYYTGTGSTLPDEAGAKLANVRSSNAATPALLINRSVEAQLPFYVDFDGTADNTFDVIPVSVAGASWIATRRQSDPAYTTNLAFDVRASADVFVMTTRQSVVPAWIKSAAFVDTGEHGNWRDNNLKLVPYQVFKKSYAAGSYVSLGSSSTDYVVLVK